MISSRSVEKLFSIWNRWIVYNYSKFENPNIKNFNKYIYKQILKEHRLDFIARYRTIQKFNIAETEQRYGKPTCMKCSWKRIKNYINVCHWKYENIIDAETKEENNIYIYMILFRYRISDKNDIDESINIDELIVKSRNNANLNILWNIFNNIEQFKRNPDYPSPVSIFN